jgi:hypothetical protein
MVLAKDGLTDREIQQGYILTCVAHPKKTMRRCGLR